jgi:beta-lactamase regulating signal transducer with metallopeptidase domain/predicted  nucleic acid-binding Zn-ribbon protein
MDAVLLLKVSVLLAGTLGAAHLLRGAPALSRHRLWTIAFAAVLALPILAVAVPVLQVPIPSWRDASPPPAISPAEARNDKAIVLHGGIARLADNDAGRGPAITDARPQVSAFARLRPALRTLLLMAWLAGALAALAALCLSLVRVRRLSRTSDAMTDAAWSASAHALAARLGLRRPARLFVSARVGTPMAGGVWRPTIFLPSSARVWSDEQRDLVLAHEIAHLAGHDPLRHVAARLAVALYWFHPLAWLAASQAAAAREQACDEAVLALGIRPSAYARVLLDLAESIQPAPPAFGALPMVQRAHLETRLMAILNDDVRAAGPARQRGGARGLVIPAVGVALCTVLLAAAQPAVQATEAAIAITAPAAHESTPAPVPVTRVRGVSAPAVPAPAMLPAQSTGEAACDWDGSGRSFSGSTSTTRINGRTVVGERIGTSVADYVVQTTLGDVRVCMLAAGAARAAGERPSQWIGRADRMILESRRGAVVQRLEVSPYGTGQRVSWQVGGADRPFDAAAQQWRDRMLAVLDATWEISSLRGEVSSLRGEISSIRGDESSLRGDISSLRGDVSSMRGDQSSIRGDESSLRGDISSIRGHLSSLQGSISSERGSISSLRADGYRSDDSARIRDAVARHENEIARLEREIRDYNADAKVAAVERQIAALDADKKVAAIEAEIKKFDLDGKVAAIEKQIAALDVTGKTAAIEKQIDALDADRRVRQLEERRDEELKRLTAAIAAIR